MQFDRTALRWTREPLHWEMDDTAIRITTTPHTDLWQRTYYHFRNDNAPVLQMTTDEQYFSFVVRTAFDSKHRFDQCGVVLYLDSENWLKASIEYENERFQHLGTEMCIRDSSTPGQRRDQPRVLGLGDDRD